MTIAWESYLPDVLPEVTGVPEEAAIIAIRNAAVDFCTRTRIWRETLPAVNIVSGTKEYVAVPQAAESKVATVLAAWINNVQLSGPLSEDNLDVNGADWRTGTSNPPYAFTLSQPDTIRLIGIPTANITGGLVARVALAPLQTATGVADFLFNDWHEEIAHGAKARLVAVSKKLWSNPAAIPFHEAKYKSGLTRARARILKGNGDSSLTVHPQRVGR